MKIFVSWSGARSQLLADALRDWIHDVVQSAECFCSTEDIRAGQRWNNEVNSWLNATDFGVLCVTPENIKAPWLNFEAGALAKRIGDDARVVPVTLGFSPSALDEPLKQFNGVQANRAGILRLMQSIAEIANPSMDIGRAFERWWPDLEAKILSIPEAENQVSQPKPPDVSEMFADIMSSVRGLAHDVRDLSPKTGLPMAEYRAAAMLLAEDTGLRDAVLSRDTGAISYLRQESRLIARRPTRAPQRSQARKVPIEELGEDGTKEPVPDDTRVAEK